jgi:hypothetical protein
VGVRKVIGALRLSLVVQFIGEAMLLTLLAVSIAFVLTIMLLPAFNNLTGKQLLIPVQQPVFWAAILGLVIMTGFVAGSYPALFLSSLKPVRILKGSLKFSAGALFFRKGLVVFQFSISIIIILGMIVIYRQLNFIQHKNLGYDRENLVYVPVEGDLIKKYTLFKEEARRMPAIVNISEMRESPTVIGHHRGGIDWEGKDPNLEVSFADAAVRYDFVKTMNLQLTEGRDFSPAFRTDSTAYLINETALARIGYKEPIGKPLNWGERRGTIIGVLKDFHFTSMHETIEPLFIRLEERPKWGTILVRTKAGKTQDAIAGLEKICKALNPKVPFTFQFSDLEYEKLYKSEQTVSRLANVFAFLAIFISCLGLFGLATFSAAQRTKEIGVRKVLGASSRNIIVLLSTNFLQPVAMAMLIAFPVAWYAMNQWLQNFAYRIDLAWWMFALAGLLTLMIALITVSFQSIKAAWLNPAGALRND